MRNAIFALLIGILFIGFVGLLILGSYLNDSQVKIQNTVTKFPDQINKIEGDMKTSFNLINSNSQKIDDHTKKIEEINSAIKKDIKLMKESIRDNANLIKKEKTALENNYKKLAKLMKGYDISLKKLDSSMDVVFNNKNTLSKEELDKFNANIANITSNVDTLNKNMDGVNSNIKNFDQSMKDITTNINTINERISLIEIKKDNTGDISSSLDQFEAKFKQFEEKLLAATAEQNTKIENINNKILSMDTKKDATTDNTLKEDFVSLKQQLTTLETKINDLSKNIDKQPKTDRTSDDGKYIALKDEMNKQLQDLKNGISSIDSKFGTLETKLNTLQDKFDTAEKNGFKPK
ncbi:MAG: hypothetical protein A2086_02995 [Spirochaetes bacterium GWD1_27_9]|nr:MAG: hypothetical protein A2Y34_10655 [Spirochaetes bacterium GWC1_27_15]OHD31353.1 MAG: hypothetical protein A2086_02995 [Spirochaetes bacterium GWD1_27_9]